MTALKFARQGLGLAGSGLMGTAQFAGRTMVSPGIIGSMARWTVASMVLSSLPNPAARKQAIDKALHEANREAEREYVSLREDMKRNNQLRKRQREFDYTQRIADARFLANPEERNFERRMADIDKKYDETLQKIAEVSLQRQQDLEESQRIMSSRRDVGMFTRYGEDIKNFGKDIYNTGVGAVQGTAGFIDRLTFGATNLHGKNADWEKRMSAKEMTMVVPKEWTDKYGQMENTEVNLSDNAGYKITGGIVKAWGKTAKDLEKAQEEIQKLREGMEKNHIDAMQKQAQERMEAQRRHTQMLAAMEQTEKTKQLGILDIETDSVIKNAQLDAILGSRFASSEQKLYAKMDKESLAEQTALSHKYNEKRNEMVATGKSAPATDQEKAELDTKYKAQDDIVLHDAKEKYEVTRKKNVNAEMEKFREDWLQRKSDAMKVAKNWQAKAKINTAFAHEYDAKAKEIREKSHADFTKSEEYKDYQKGVAERGKAKQNELDGLNSRKEVRKRGDIEGRAIDHQEAVEKAQVALKFEERKRAVQAAMQLPIRGGLEESFNMVSDELIKQGETQRLGGNSEMAKVVDESIKPALEKLDRHYEKLERVLQSGEVRAIVQVKM